MEDIGLLQQIWTFIKENDGAVSAVVAILVAIGAFLLWVLGFFAKKTPETSPATFAPIQDPTKVEVAVTPTALPGGAITISLDDFEAKLATNITEAEEKLKTAHDEEKALLQQQIEELTRRAQNPESALAEAQDTIRKLEDTLAREGNEIGEARMSEARESLEAGDFSIADDIFAEIEAREQLAVKRAARAAFARGKIAEQEIRWADAAEHFAKAAHLNPTYSNLYSARELAFRSARNSQAFSFGSELLDAARTEFGESHENFATALNEHATTLFQAGRYEEAEPLYKRAIEIDGETIGENHPNHATHLNNLALLYDKTGRYNEAEPLFKRTIDIDKATIGEHHPSYAIRLNNLANLYYGMGRYDEAEPLHKQAIDIDKATIGEDHPDYAIDLSNLANLYERMGRYNEAEPLYKQAIDIGKKTIGENHPNYATRLNNLANLYVSMGRYNKAEPLYNQAIKIAKDTLGPDHPDTITFTSNLAILQSAR